MTFEKALNNGSLKDKNNKIIDKKSFKNYKEIETIEFTGQELKNIPEWVKECINLKTFYGTGNLFHNLDNLEPLDYLENVYINDNNLIDISGLKNKLRIKNLRLNNNPLTDEGVDEIIPTLLNIKNISLNNNQIRNTYFFRNLHNLETLSLNKNKIKFINLNNKNLKDLSIDNNSIKKININLPSLENLNLNIKENMIIQLTWDKILKLSPLKTINKDKIPDIIEEFQKYISFGNENYEDKLFEMKQQKLQKELIRRKNNPNLIKKELFDFKSNKKLFQNQSKNTEINFGF